MDFDPEHLAKSPRTVCAVQATHNNKPMGIS